MIILFDFHISIIVLIENWVFIVSNRKTPYSNRSALMIDEPYNSRHSLLWYILLSNQKVYFCKIFK